MQNDEYKDVVAVENQTVVTHPWKGAYLNKWLPLLEKYKREFQPLTDVEWTVYEPKSEMMVMNEILPSSGAKDVLWKLTSFTSQQ